MKVLITEAINSAMNAFFDALGNDTYKEQYRAYDGKMVRV